MLCYPLCSNPAETIAFYIQGYRISVFQLLATRALASYSALNYIQLTQYMLECVCVCRSAIHEQNTTAIEPVRKAEEFLLTPIYVLNVSCRHQCN